MKIVQYRVLLGSLLTCAALFALSAFADSLEPAVQAKVDAKIKEIQAWAAAPEILKAVKAHNSSLPAEPAAMNQEVWKGLSILDPFVRSFTKGEAAEFLKNKKSTAVSEAFLSGSDGLKVAFLAKPSNWSHKGKPKHDVPMTGKTWQGQVEVDESTGTQQLQIAVPVLDGEKPIGSLVVGLSISKLTKE
jgi:hypothetical protein